MGTFNKLKKSRKSSHLDEKIEFLNKELEKTGVILETPANSTANIYNTTEFVPGLPQITSQVPDATGFANGDSQDANGGDESNPDTWEDGWNNITDMKNPNNLNGVTNRNIPLTPDLSGWVPVSNGSPSGRRPSISGGAGIGVWTISAGIGGGKSIGTLTANNEFVQILIPDNIFGTYNYPSWPKQGWASGGYYGSYSTTEYEAARNIAIAYQNNRYTSSWVSRKCWVNYAQATSWGGPSYAEYTGVKKTTTIKNFDGTDRTLYWKLKDVSILVGSNSYISQDGTPDARTTMFRTGLDDGEYYPGSMSGFMDFLKGALGASKEALEWLMGAAGEVADAAGDLAGQLGWASGIADSVSNNTPHIADEPSDAQKQDYLNELDANSVFDPSNPYNIQDKGTPINDQKQNFADDNIYVDDSGTVQSNIGPNGEKGYYEKPNAGTLVTGGDAIGSRGEAQTQIYQNENGDWVFAYDDHAYWNINSDDAGEISNAAAEVAANIIHQNADEKYGRTGNGTLTSGGVDNTSPNTGDMSNYPCNSTACIRGDNTSSWEINVNDIQNDALRNKILAEIESHKKQNEKYEPKGKVIKEGWESPKHVGIDKDEKKRWFKEKDVAPVYPKKAPPKLVRGYHPDMLPKLDTPIPQIKVSKKDLIRAHILSEFEAQEWIDKIDRLNDYIARNPDILAYARERYPVSDPHLAALNYKMDMQLAASDEYLEKQFPENIRLYNKVLDATKKSIKLTDPKTFKSEKGVFTTFNKLARVQHVDTVYQPKERTLKLKKRTKNSVNRFLFKPKEKTKDDILKDKLAVLDKEMQKTMPDT